MSFKRLEGDTCVLRTKGGVYQQCDLYSFDHKLFAKVSGGFVLLKADGSTSKVDVMLQHLETDRDLWSGKFGRLMVDKPNPEAKPAMLDFKPE